MYCKLSSLTSAIPKGGVTSTLSSVVLWGAATYGVIS